MSRLLQIPRAIKLLALCFLSLVLGLLVFVKLSLHIWLAHLGGKLALMSAGILALGLAHLLLT
ncbi:hypothetical protein [Abiotrophia defectiva]|uniref:hypothetical protein n=1 Tax=Abiotrophia defectiva TaxID=46125 RepID=UPI0028D71452|nr:hypothetical protein [Abiotrophia defectiva]